MTTTPQKQQPAQVAFMEAFLYWHKLGFISFGGPAGQISMMHQELVEKRRWISEHRFLHALNSRWCYQDLKHSNWQPILAG